MPFLDSNKPKNRYTPKVFFYTPEVERMVHLKINPWKFRTWKPLFSGSMFSTLGGVLGGTVGGGGMWVSEASLEFLGNLGSFSEIWVLICYIILYVICAAIRKVSPVGG